KCGQCPKTFSRQRDVARHISTKHQKKQFHTCKKCGTRFPRKDTLFRHKRNV
ncbi:hypothetical protein BDB00DRAFT_723993, partial [Zychaea mexicana]|uniref:uncharacterized protein n=1 Tax=Zychaea mexicana TaxID=64656 RepID=UPI0022FDECA4